VSTTLIPEAAAGLPTEAWRAPERSHAQHVDRAPGGILIATDGSPGADAAVRAGITLACRHALDAELLTVYEPSSAAVEEAITAVNVEELEARLQAEQRERVEAQRERAGADRVVWPLRFEVGPPAHTIARVARARGDDLIVVGLGGHGPLERMLGRETALQVIRHAGVPVLAVAPEASAALPRHAVAAVDFSDSSLRASQTALRLLGGVGTLTLIHVAPRLAGPPSETEALARFHLDDAADMLRLFRCRLAARSDAGDAVRVRTVTRTGDPATAILAFARAAGADLIVTGSHGRSFVQRALLGSVSTRLLRSAGCSVLVGPR